MSRVTPNRSDASSIACGWCGTTFLRSKTRKGHCSDKCSATAKRARENARTRRRVAAGLHGSSVCRWCDEAFTRTHPTQECCSRSCGVRLRNERNPQPKKAPATSSPVPWRECQWCGKWMVSRLGRKYCSKACSDIQDQRRSKASPIEYGSCQRCGACFVRRAGKVGEHCSERCAKRTRNTNRRHIQRSRSKVGERITLVGLGNRDGWRCHLCGKTVTARPGNTPRSPSTDHLIPVTAGGEHTWQNVALAHRSCNSLRAATGAAQLRLIA